MTQDERDEIVRLAEEAHTAAERHRKLGFMNSIGPDQEATKRIRADYALAGAEARETRSKLEGAISKLATDYSLDIQQLAAELIRQQVKAA